MSTGFNPYFEWLDIELQANKPNYFELLGVDRGEKNSRQLDVAARTQLSKLNSVDPGNRKEQLDQLKSEVKQAFAVLSCPKQRAEYELNLASFSPPPSVEKAEMLPPDNPDSKTSEAVEAKPDKTDPATPEPVAPGETAAASEPAVTKPTRLKPVASDQVNSTPGKTEPPTQQPASINNPRGLENFLQPQKVSEADMLPPDASSDVSPEMPSVSDVPQATFVPRVDPANADLDPPSPQEIPVAKLATNSEVEDRIPSAKPVPTAVPVATPPAAPTAPSTSSAPTTPSYSVENSVDDVPDPEAGLEKLVIAEQPTGVSRTQLALIAVTALVSLAIIAGGVYALGLVSAGGTVADGTPGEDDGDVDREGEVIEEPADDSAHAQKGTEGASDPKNGEPVEAGVDSNPGSADVNSDDESAGNDGNSSAGGSQPNTDTELTEWQRPAASVLLDRVMQLSIDERRRLRNQMMLIRRQWLRRETGRPDLESLDIDSTELVNELDELSKSMQEVSRHLEQFWQQFRRSCNANRGDIEIDERVVGFVEAAPDYLVLRIAGNNRRYDYRFVPPGLIVAIIERNAIDDIPTYRLQKAAYLISNLDQRPDLLSQIEELLESSESDGHDVYALRLAARLHERELAEPASRPDYQMLGELTEMDSTKLQAIPELRFDSPEESRRQLEVLLRSGKVLELSSVADIGSEPEEKYLAHLEALRQLAVRGGDALLVEITLDLLADHGANLPSELRFDSFLDTADSAIADKENANWYCDVMLRYLRSGADGLSPSKVRKLGEAAIEIARQFSLDAFEVQLQALTKRP